MSDLDRDGDSTQGLQTRDVGGTGLESCQWPPNVVIESSQDPKALAASTRRRILGLARTSRWVPYRETSYLASDLCGVLQCLEWLLPRDPVVAFQLAEAFIQTDERTFERIDDSDGDVAMVYRDTCRLWLKAGAAAELDGDRVARVYQLAKDDGYGIRDVLLLEASVLLSEHEMRRLARRFEDDFFAERSSGHEGSEYARLSASGNLGMIAKTLRDAKLYEHSKILSGEDLNDPQRLDLARHYVEFGSPAGAVRHLAAMEDQDHRGRWQILLEIYRQQGRLDEQLTCLWHLFEANVEFEVYEKILARTPHEDKESARVRAQSVVVHFSDLVRAATFFLFADLPDRAEELMIERAAELSGKSYVCLLRLIERAEPYHRPRMESLCYRELLLDILASGRSQAYGCAARYFRKLEALERHIDEDSKRMSHSEFVVTLRGLHGRKRSFWKQVE